MSPSNELQNTTDHEPKLSLSSLPNRLKLKPRTELAVTPPVQTLATIPFKWEEAPGKPLNDVVFRPKSKAVRCLHLLPNDDDQQQQSDNSPTYLSRSHSLSSTASFKRNKSSRLFGSTSARWSSKWNNNGGVDFCSHKVNIVRITRKSSFFSFSSSTSFFLTNIYESLKQAVPWRRSNTNLQP